MISIHHLLNKKHSSAYLLNAFVICIWHTVRWHRKKQLDFLPSFLYNNKRIKLQKGLPIPNGHSQLIAWVNNKTHKMNHWYDPKTRTQNLKMNTNVIISTGIPWGIQITDKSKWQMWKCEQWTICRVVCRMAIDRLALVNYVYETYFIER